MPPRVHEHCDAAHFFPSVLCTSIFLQLFVLQQATKFHLSLQYGAFKFRLFSRPSKAENICHKGNMKFYVAPISRQRIVLCIRPNELRIACQN